MRRSPQGIMEQIATLDAESAEVLENIKSLLNGASVMSRKIEVLSREVRLTGVNDQDYVCLTDIARYKDIERTDYLISNWLRNRNTLEFLGLWEQINNPGFNPIEFDGIRKQAGLNSFILTAKQWTERTGAVGIQSKAGRYGGTFAHLDIALEFASWISVEFKLYLIKEFQRLKETERQTLGWDIRRNLAKINYRIHTDAIQTHLIPPELGKAQTTLCTRLKPMCSTWPSLARLRPSGAVRILAKRATSAIKPPVPNWFAFPTSRTSTLCSSAKAYPSPNASPASIRSPSSR